ncbi:NAD(P)/FAD-dependent oxidoreductase [Calidithermus roseus]|uniref:Putidaredoxin reductase n=1 Tax=Calidithermus roseus TaxID=1644118 RepID=A0A399ES59_9DEIN|nr:FAD-dependent oxidoreductase [Calidithermus roseus]RIH85889.1 Putidaredoxin reductase [Calidithermus roseus]
MPEYTYLIVGGGMAAEAALRGIREIDTAGTVGMVSDEPHPPYNRPPLSKGLWKDRTVDEIWRRADDLAAELHLRRRIVALDLERSEATDEQGEVYRFKKLLLATGCTPRRLPFGQEDILYYRTLEDYYRLRSQAEHGERFAVIGGGFIGSEIAAALVMNGKSVSMLFPEAGIGGRLFPPELARFLVDFYRGKGVDVRPGEGVVGLERRGQELRLHLQSGETLMVEGVIAGIGVSPNSELAAQAGLRTEDGIVVDELGQTSAPGVYAAGDVARFYNPALGSWLRVEHEDHANTHGRLVGRNMAAAHDPYHHLPFFYSDLFELGYEAVGILDSRLQTMSDWKDPFRQGVVYYLEAGRVRGVLLWNTWGKVEEARALIAEPGPFRPQDLRGRIG